MSVTAVAPELVIEPPKTAFQPPGAADAEGAPQGGRHAPLEEGPGARPGGAATADAAARAADLALRAFAAHPLVGSLPAAPISWMPNGSGKSPASGSTSAGRPIRLIGWV